MVTRSPITDLALLSVVFPQAFPGHRGAAAVDAIEELIVRDGFDVIEVSSLSTDLRPRLTAIFEETRAQLIFLAGLPLLRAGLSLSADDDQRRRAVSLACALIDEARALGASRMLVTSGPDPGPERRVAAVDQLVKSLVELCQYGSRANGHAPINISLEPTDRTLHRRQLIGPTREALAVCARVAEVAENIELNLDLSHMLQCGEDASDSVAQAIGYCRHIHLANCVVADAEHSLYGDLHPPFGHPGSEVGVDELTGFLSSLYSTGYLSSARETVIGLEVVPLLRSHPWSTIRQARHVLDRAWLRASAAA